MFSTGLRYFRLVIALFLTAIILPFLHAYFFYVLMYVGISPVFLALNLAGLALIAMLVRGLSRDPSLSRWRLPLTVVILLLWIGGSALTIPPLLELRVWPPLHVLGAAISSLWEPALAWSPFYPPGARRRRVLLVLFLAQGLYPLLYRIDGVSGDDLFIVVYRTAPRAEPVDTYLGAEPVSRSSMNYSGYLGTNRDATIPRFQLDPNWKIHPPTLVWRRPIGAGWGAFAITTGVAVTQEQRGDRESVVAYDLATGKELWVHQDPIHFNQSMGGPGPRATPTIENGKVYSVGATGQLNCLDLLSGSLHWSTNILADAGASMDDNGVTSSPLVTDGQVILSPTGSKTTSLIAYDTANGSMRWQTTGAPASYSSPNVTVFDGQRQLVHLDGDGLAGHDMLTGATLWRFPFNENGNSCPQPILRPENRNSVFVSTDRDGAALIDIKRASQAWKAAEVWHIPQMRTKFSNPVCFEDHVYGLDAGILACLRLADGQLLWKSGRYHHGQMLLVGRHLLILSENGELVLIEPSPQGRNELGKISALEGKTWNNLAISGDLLLVRNAEQAACYRLAGHEEKAEPDTKP